MPLAMFRAYTCIDEAVTKKRKTGKKLYIYEVESRAGYPEMSDQSTFWGFFIYILLLNVKQLLSIV